MARLAALRTRWSCQGGFGSHWSGRSSQNTEGATARDTSLNPGLRWMSSATGPVRRYATSTSPFLSAAARVVSSGRLRSTSRLTWGSLRQNPSNASSTSSTPGVKLTNLYGPAPIGAFFDPDSATFSTYFFGTIHAAPDALVPETRLNT